MALDALHGSVVAAAQRAHAAAVAQQRRAYPLLRAGAHAQQQLSALGLGGCDRCDRDRASPSRRHQRRRGGRGRGSREHEGECDNESPRRDTFRAEMRREAGAGGVGAGAASVMLTLLPVVPGSSGGSAGAGGVPCKQPPLALVPIVMP